MKKENNYDLIIIGGGPIGLACAIQAKKAKLNYLILEKGALVNSLYNYPVNMKFFSTSERLEIGGVPFVSNNPKPTRAEALEYYRRIVSSFDLKIHLFEKVTDIKKSGKIFKIINPVNLGSQIKLFSYAQSHCSCRFFRYILECSPVYFTNACGQK